MDTQVINVLYGQGSQALAHLVAQSLSDTGVEQVCCIPLEHRSETMQAGTFTVVCADFRSDMPAVLSLQSDCHRAGVSVLLISESPGWVNIGPMSEPGQSTCINCWYQWVLNNHRQPIINSDSSNASQLLAQRQLTTSATSVLNTILTRLLKGFGEDNSLRGKYYRLNTLEIQCSSHRFNATTTCQHCQSCQDDTAQAADITLMPRPKRLATDKRVPNPRLNLDEVKKQFVDRHVGVIKHVYQSITSSLMPMYAAEMQLMGTTLFESGYGRAESAQKSEMVAILEGIERFAGYSPKRTRTQVRGSYSQIARQFPNQCVDPEAFILHDPALRNAHFSLLDYSPELEINWCWGYSMRQRKPVLVPEQLVYYRLDDEPGKPVNRFVYDSSNGCAMGGCLEEAILCGLYEVVERDAYLSTWYSNIVPNQIANASITEPRISALIARAESEGFEIHLFNITLDIAIPAVWAMIVDPSENAPVKSYCASAAHAQWNEAIFAALVEVVTSMGVYQHSMPEQREQALAMVENDDLVQDMPDHVLLYSAPETYERLHFLHQGKLCTLAQCEAELPTLTLPDLTDELTTQVDKVLDVAHDVIVVQQSFDEMEELGLHCVKVLIPGLQPVTFGHQHRRVSYARLDHAAKAKGQWRAHFNAETINPFPHNFP